jgi:hypothetical protein
MDESKMQKAMAQYEAHLEIMRKYQARIRNEKRGDNPARPRGRPRKNNSAPPQENSEVAVAII